MPPHVVIAERYVLRAYARDAEVASGCAKIRPGGNEGDVWETSGNMFRSAVGRAVVDDNQMHSLRQRAEALKGFEHLLRTVVRKHDHRYLRGCLHAGRVALVHVHHARSSFQQRSVQKTSS